MRQKNILLLKKLIFLVLLKLLETSWAKVRETYFGEGNNYQSLNIIESAIFFVHLSDDSPKTWTDQGRLLLCDNSQI